MSDMYRYEGKECSFPQLRRELSKDFDVYETFLEYMDAVSPFVMIGGGIRAPPSRILKGLVAIGDLSEDDVIRAAIDFYINAEVTGTVPRGGMPRQLYGVVIRRATPARTGSRSVRARPGAKTRSTKGARRCRTTSRAPCPPPFRRRMPRRQQGRWSFSSPPEA